MPMVETMLLELAQEATTTRRLLERVPNDQLAWKPHAKSMSLGQLALHVAAAPGQIAALLRKDEVQVPDFASPPSATSTAEAVETLERSIQEAQQVLQGMDDQTAMSSWTLVRGDKHLFAAPKIAVARSILLNHWYHHRGQLSVYLRLLDVPLPSIYGPSADENPFASEG
jgi:uncharacterized damage-inducible protein DinB